MNVIVALAIALALTTANDLTTEQRSHNAGTMSQHRIGIRLHSAVAVLSVSFGLAMRIKNDFVRQKQEQDFRARVLASIEKPKENRFWKFLNKPFTLWLMSLLLISVIGSYLSAYQQCRKDADDEIEHSTKIAREIFQRELNIRTIIMKKSTVDEMRQELAKPNAYYPELSGLQIEMLQEAYASFMNRVINVKVVPPTSDQSRLLELRPISLGVIPSNIGDKDIPTLREYAAKMLAQAWPLPLPGFGVSRFHPACGPSNILAPVMHCRLADMA
jgi:hypothetical protein